MYLGQNERITKHKNGQRLTLVKLLICLQIHLIPYGTVSILSIIVVKKVFAISINIVNLGWMIACTSALAAATSGATPRGREAGRVPASSSICCIICSYTWSQCDDPTKRGEGVEVAGLSEENSDQMIEKEEC